LSDDGKAQLSQKQARDPPSYESQTMASADKSCYGPRLLRTHSTSKAARRVAIFTGLVLLASVPVALAADAAGPGTDALRADQSSLEAKEDAATLELYALESELGRARKTLQSLTARRSQLAQERAAARERLEIARGALELSQTRLAQLVRTLYEQTGAADPLAIILGAGSLEEALAGLDGLSRAAGENSRIIDQARVARGRLGRLDASLAAKEATLRELTAAAQAQAAELEASASARAGYVAGLRREQGLNAQRLAAIQAQARAAQARSATIAAAEPAVSSLPAADAVAAELADAPVPGVRTLTVSSTGYALRGRTATGINTAYGVVAVDPSVIPLGTRMTIPGYGEGVAADTGGAVHGATIDLWFPTVEQALQWGRRTVTIVIR
jgi:3D (Asp-Asp-Asp) domain-containing protein